MDVSSNCQNTNQDFDNFKKEVSDLILFQQIMTENWSNANDEENIINDLLLTSEIKEKYLPNKLLFAEFLHSIRRFLDSHPDSYQFIEKILFLIINEIRSTFISNELYTIFFWNRNILLFFYENECINIESLKQYSDFFKFYYFYPEFYEKKINFFIKTSKLYENLMQQFSTPTSPYRYDIDEDQIKSFKKRRQINHSDEKVAQIIRNDDFESFMKYISSTNLNFNTRIKKSAFESNSLLFFEPTLFEYSCFFQSINIFRFIFLNNGEISKNLAKFAVAGGSYEIIHLLETKKVVFDDDCLITAIEYHRNDIADYLIDNYQLLNQTSTDKILKACIRSYNFTFLINYIENNSSIIKNLANIEFILNEACQNSIFHLVKFALSFTNININQINEKSGVFFFIFYFIMLHFIVLLSVEIVNLLNFY